jgi:hypothetical protein
VGLRILGLLEVVEPECSPLRPCGERYDRGGGRGRLRHSRPFAIRRIFGHVAALAERDSYRALRFVVDAEELGEDDPFTPAVLEELGKLTVANRLCTRLVRSGSGIE